MGRDDDVVQVRLTQQRLEEGVGVCEPCTASYTRIGMPKTCMHALLLALHCLHDSAAPCTDSLFGGAAHDFRVSTPLQQPQAAQPFLKDDQPVVWHALRRKTWSLALPRSP